MPGFLLHVGAQVMCSHAGQAQATVPNPRVTVSGQPTVLMTSPYVVAGCTLPPPTAANGPCVSAQFLFTNSGERVNRPDFGSGLLQLVFAPNSPELAATVQFTIQAGLQRWLSDVILVQKVEVTSEDSTLRAVIQYVVNRTNQTQT